MRIEEIKNIYRNTEDEIKLRLKEFRKLGEYGSEKDLFTELIFCLLTPQSKAVSCWETVETLLNENLLFEGSAEEISGKLNKVRFRNRKAEYIVEARKHFPLCTKIKKFSNIYEAREWLVKNVKGMGYKEASHFLRNIGYGDDLAILDRHILKNLKYYGVIKHIPASLTRKKYLEIERKMKEFSERINIPMSHLDLVLWYKETGRVFK